eukprot:15467442-Alexandrium_andersonii.AAC.1
MCNPPQSAQVPSVLQPPQSASAMRNIQNRFGRSELELRWPGNDLEIGLRSSRWVRSSPLLARMPNRPTKTGIEGV